MPEPAAVILVVALVLLVIYLVGNRGGVRRSMRSLADPPEQVITTRRFSPWGWWSGSDLVYRTDRLIHPRGRRRTPRGVKARGDRDLTLVEKDPRDTSD